MSRIFTNAIENDAMQEIEDPMKISFAMSRIETFD